jgi:hypothetical protein
MRSGFSSLIQSIWAERALSQLLRQGIPVQFTFAMLEILTKRPGGWATLDELGREIAATHGQEASSRFPELSDVDVLGASLVVEDNNGLRITKAGRSVLRALEALHGTHPESHMPNQTRAQKAIDDLMGAGVRQGLLNLGLRAAGEKLILESLEGEQEDIETEPEVISSEMSSDLASEPEAVVDMAERTVEGNHLGKARETDIPTAISFNLPAFLNLKGRATIKAPIRLRSRNYILFPSVAASLKRFTGILRGHIEQDTQARGTGRWHPRCDPHSPCTSCNHPLRWDSDRGHSDQIVEVRNHLARATTRVP